MFEAELTKILGDVLQHEAIGPEDDLFEHGGSSIHAIEIARRVFEELGLELQLVDVLRHPSVRALGTLLVTLTPAPTSRVTPHEPSSRHPISPVQRSLLVLERMSERADAAVVPVIMELEANLEPELARAAYRRVLERHEILRTTFTMEDDGPAQRVGSASDMAAGWRYTDARGATDPARSLQALHDAAASEPFDLERGPLIRLHLVDLADGLSVGVLSIHHIVSDGFSAATLERELRWTYDELAGQSIVGQGIEAPATLAFHYKDYVYWLDEWTAGPEGARAQAYWSGVLDGHVPSLHFGEPRAEASFATAMDERALDAATLAALHRLSERLEVTVFVVLQACIRALLRARAGDAGFVLGVAVTTRDVAGSSGQIGPYVNTLPVRVAVPARASFAQLVAATDESMLAALSHRLLPVERIAAQLTGGAPLFDVGFTMQPRRAAGPRTRVELPVRSDPLGIALLFIAYDESRGLALRIRYRTAVVSRVEVEQLRDALVRVIHAVDERPEDPLAEVLDPPAGAGRFIELDLG